MRVLFITSQLKGGGAETFLYELIKGLSKFSDIDLAIISGSSIGASTYRILGSRVYVVPNDKLYFQKWLLGTINPLIKRRIEKIIQIERPDIIHLNNFIGLGHAVLDSCHDLGIPIVVTIHDYWPLCPKTTLVYTKGDKVESPCQDVKRCLRDRCIKLIKICPFLNYLFVHRYEVVREKILDFLRSSLVIAVSNYVKNTLESYGISNVRVIYNGRTFKALDLSYETWRQRNYILYLGGPRFEKGYHVVKELLKRVTSNPESLRLVSDFIFAIRTNESEFKYPVKLEVSKYFCDVEAYYSKSFITLVPSIYYEPLPYTVIEAVAYGSLVLAFKVGGIPEVIPCDFFLVEPNNVDSFYEKFIEIIRSDRQLLYEKLEMIRDYVIKMFNAERMINDYYNLYLKLLR